MKFKLLLSFAATLIYTNTICSISNRIIRYEIFKIKIWWKYASWCWRKSNFRFESYSPKDGEQEMLSKFINKYGLKCTTESFSKKLKVGSRECQLENKESDDGVPLLMLGIENDKIIAVVYSGEDVTFLKKMKCSFSEIACLFVLHQIHLTKGENIGWNCGINLYKLQLDFYLLLYFI